MNRAPADINRITDGVGVPLHEISPDAANNPADQYEERKSIVFAKRLGQSFDGERRVSIHFTKTRGVRCIRGVHQFILRGKFRQ